MTERPARTRRLFVLLGSAVSLAAAVSLTGGPRVSSEAALSLEPRAADPPAAPAGIEQARELGPGDEVLGQLEDGEEHVYRLDIGVGRAGRVEADQRGETDVELTLVDAVGRKLHSIDTPSGAHGVEILTVIPESEPVFLRVSSYPGAPPGGYGLRLAGGAPATAVDRQAVRAERHYLSGRRLLRRVEPVAPGLDRGEARLRSAAVSFRRAAELWEEIGDPRAARFAWLDLGEVAGVLERRDSARRAFGRAWSRLSREEPSRRAGRAAYGLALELCERGDAATALPLARRAVELARLTGHERDAVIYLGAVGRSLEYLGEPTLAARAYRDALAGYEERGDAGGVALSWIRLGELYRGMRDLERAEQSLRAGHRAAREAGDVEHQARALDGLGTLDRLRFDAREDPALLRRAEDRLRAALGLYRRIGDAEGEAVVLGNLARIYRLLGEPDRALALYRRSAQRLDGLGEEVDAATVRVNLAGLERETGRLGAARRHYRESLAVCRSRGATRCEAAASYGLARLALEAEELDLARRLAGRAVSLVESVRSRADPEMQVAYLDNKYDYHLLWISVLDRLAAAERAFEAGERARASQLLDSLTAPGAGSRRARSLAEVRRELLDERTALLATNVGEHEAFAWLVTRDALVVRRLPERPRLERRVEELTAALAGPGPLARRAETAARAIASDLVVPFVGELERRGIERLLVAADGDLHRIPTGPLLDLAGLRPAGLAEVVHLPSASVQVELSRRLRGRRAALGALVVSDPVYGDDDSRFGGDGDAAQATGPTIRAGRPSALVRLVGTAREAQAVCGRLPAASCRSLTGFDATREAVLEEDLQGYRYLHFATHTLVDEERPERSRIVLAQRDRSGRARPGFLSLDDVRGLELAADLVVLSGCHTATGRAYRGEGPIGLARGFLEAGAASVLVSLWEVDDGATAELFDRFYDGLLGRGLPAAAALADAQRQVASNPRWRSPYYWAGFQLLGDPPPPAPPV